MDESIIIASIYSNTLSNKYQWHLTDTIPDVLYKSTNIFIVSCYETNNEQGDLYLFKYREPMYDGEHDTFYYTENIDLAYVERNRITWRNSKQNKKLNDLYEHINSKISSIFSFVN